MRRCLLVLAAAAASDDVPFELRDVYGPPPANAAVALPLLHEPRVKLWWPALDDVVEIAQDSSEPYDAPTTLWPAGAVLAHALASDCASWKDRAVLELGVGVGAPALGLARCGASVVATDISEAALALAAENTNVTAENTLAGGKTFASMKLETKGKVLEGGADGIRCDKDGNLWSSAGWAGHGFDGVHVFEPKEGKRIGQILLPEICSNLCFGGIKRNRLFMTASQSVYSLYVETQGAHHC